MARTAATDEVARIVRGQIRERWPNVSIVIRADSGFCRDELMTWCEENHVKYVLGLAGNSRLHKRIARESRKAKLKSKRTGKPARVFADFEYRTRDSWSAKRRVIGKAEWTTRRGEPALHRHQRAIESFGAATLPLRAASTASAARWRTA